MVTLCPPRTICTVLIEVGPANTVDEFTARPSIETIMSPAERFPLAAKLPGETAVTLHPSRPQELVTPNIESTSPILTPSPLGATADRSTSIGRVSTRERHVADRTTRVVEQLRGQQQPNPEQ